MLTRRIRAEKFKLIYQYSSYVILVTTFRGFNLTIELKQGGIVIAFY